MFVKIWGKSKTIIVWYVGMSFCPCYLIIQTQEGLTIETSCQVMYERKVLLIINNLALSYQVLRNLYQL